MKQVKMSNKERVNHVIHIKYAVVFSFIFILTLAIPAFAGEKKIHPTKTTYNYKGVIQERLWRSCRATLVDLRSPSAERGCASSRARCARNAVRARTAGALTQSEIVTRHLVKFVIIRRL